MTVPGCANPLLMYGDAGSYQIQRSLRCNSSDSAYLSRTPGTAGNRRTWTWAGWVKRSKLGTYQYLLSANGGGIYRASILFNDTDNLTFAIGNTSAAITTAAVYRDVSAWYHLVFVLDTTQATQANGMKIYINGVQQTVTASGTYTQNDEGWVNAANQHLFGYPGNYYLDGYLANIQFIDGQALTPASFAETDATTGQWIPKAYSGSYGTNGFYLQFADNSSNTASTLGTDTSGLGNNWTPNNFSVTAGAGNDSLVDVPTNGAQTDTGVGGEVRGNYCVLNPLQIGSAITLSNGNLDLSAASSGSQRAWGTIGVSTGKWYFEYVQTSGSFTQAVGIKSSFAQDNNNNYLYSGSDGNKINASGSNSSYGATWALNDVVGVAFDLDNGTITFYKNGTSQGQAFSGITAGTYFPFVLGWAGGTFAGNVNFGQRPFAYTAPSGFKALCTANLPAPLVTKPNTVFDVITYTGTGSSLTLPNGSSTPTSISFTPDFAWIKGRSGATDHALYDAVRGVQKDLVSNSTSAETTETTGLTAFGTNTFTVGSLAKLNTSSSTYVAWAWNAGGSTVSNTSGSITSSVRANPTAGFSIVGYTGTGSAGTLGHGLGVKPQLIIVKSRTQARDWIVYHSAYGATQYTILNGTLQAQSTTSAWNNTEPTSTVFTIGNAAEINTNGSTNIAYCFAPVVGYSSFGSYTGNGSADGPFVYTGFRPRWIMVKCVDSAQNWFMLDTARNTYNAVNSYLMANSSSAEDANNSTVNTDFTSNGFKVRATTSNLNNNAQNYVFAAFAESPFQYARAR